MTMNEQAEDLVSQAMAPLATDDELPRPLQESIRRHQETLVSLAASLLAGGQSEAMVKSTIDSLFSSYRDELTRTIVALRDQPGAGS